MIYKLCNQVKHYEWGSQEFIPRLMGLATNGEPWAELWMGSHSGSPSLAMLPDGKISLGELIARDPRRYLGSKTQERYGSLPFLFKLLAAEKPLSIQVHPNLAQAREGFERENMEGLPPDAPKRSYRDSNHKPEILCAITPFSGMCGFRSPGEILRLFDIFLYGSHLREGLAPLTQALEIPNEASALRNFLQALFGLSLPLRRELTKFVLSSELELMRYFAQLYPDDPAIISPLYLNAFRLEPGEAIFLEAGVPHAYIHGCGVELMANSDNVLRGGLTPKHIDVPELIKVLNYVPSELQIIKPQPACSCFTYPAPCDEFSLTVMRQTQTEFASHAPSICIVTEGEVSVGGTILKQGESAFIPPCGDSPLPLRGSFTLYIASVPLP
ncbi:MAG: mannose-6-phosphate isomerase, class I [Treponema sp.]|jgi:mannose-6-phosphate isomerase|nr:mannose-6-phosphate isomerase, class I [Treponema sp.]